MADSWVNPAERGGSDIHLDLRLDPATGGGRRAALGRALREAIEDGRLAPDTRLPPYRSLAADLGLARNTVAETYAELVAEGWLVARQGAGTWVAPRARPAATPHGRSAPAPTRPALPAHNLRQGLPDAGSFPRTVWLAAARRAVNAAPSEAFGPGDPRGRPELREALARYLARARGVRAGAESIVVCSGVAHALRLLFGRKVLGGKVLGGPLAVESYGLPFHRSILATARVRTVPLTVDEHGAHTGELTDLPGIRAALLTPAHQFPTGGTLHPERRAAAVDWARRSGGVLLEDDYDGEFRYDRDPVGAVQGLDPQRVVYLGSVSKSLSPALRLGWMVLPDHLIEPVLCAKGEREAWSSVTDQLTLADLLASGQYDRHVRRARQRYRGRRDRLVGLLARRVPHVTPTGIAAGLHVVLNLPPGTERSTVTTATATRVSVDGLAAFRHPDATDPPRDGLVVGYAAPPDHAYGAALEALCHTLPPQG
ncbi:aminotransferase class I/II-fold pyridoxal phosphate-dependent enzyme [Streptomyces sp. 3MP-14]|uniref:Aminotransferase class I/II-fold pyridoxal phosphate-dependent enzyme n=1 Tax=Streptomyces mimosae TaxID=2586635 RepID=A0A5N6A379_9ACTN|nr:MULTISPECIES: PLP-dependent aminotransferase family protein [Streptomyces]KAB8162895.1 aminotransferase class I/II-fold pyridoxal phosphate-dependent enzyme [Streptomyces mimosae]KAB8179108.1 aminotransferase class I/II-fold pyridoxal phosphate-dependent enzyme [Streptomyces sp. 3MP-14]